MKAVRDAVPGEKPANELSMGEGKTRRRCEIRLGRGLVNAPPSST